MTNAHLDMNQIIQEELQQRRAKSVFTAGPKGNTRDSRVGSAGHIHIGDEGIVVDRDSRLNADFGPQQVESLLRYVVDFPLEKAMSDAEDDADAVRHLRSLKG